MSDKNTQTSNSNRVSTKGTRCIIYFVCSLIVWILAYQTIEPLSEWIIFSLFKFQPEDRLGSAIQFFIFEVPKVFLLLVLIVYVVGMIRTFFTASRTRRLLAGRKQLPGNIMAALLGIVTPFCTCSAIPLFIGFIESGVPLGVTFSFLVAAPMINEVAAVMLFGLFGFRVAFIYISSGLVIAILSGWVIGRLKMERYVEDWVYSVQAMKASEAETALSWADRAIASRRAVTEIVSKVWLYIIFGIAIGAGIHGYVPTGIMASFMDQSEWWTVPAAVLLGVPMYSNAAGIIPIVHALLEKGASLGTALAFMMAVIGLSLPEAVILRKVLKPYLLGVFFAVVACGIVLTGYLFNWLL